MRERAKTLRRKKEKEKKYSRAQPFSNVFRLEGGNETKNDAKMDAYRNPDPAHSFKQLSGQHK